MLTPAELTHGGLGTDTIVMIRNLSLLLSCIHSL